MKRNSLFIFLMMTFVFVTSCIPNQSDLEDIAEEDLKRQALTEEEEEYDDDDVFYIIGAEEEPVDNPDAISEILNQCSEDLHSIDPEWSSLLLSKVFQKGYPADYMEKEQLTDCWASYLYKNEDIIILEFEILYGEYFPEVAGAIGVYDLDNGEFKSAQLFDRFTEEETMDYERDGYAVDYSIYNDPEDARGQFGDTLVFITSVLEYEQYEFDEEKTGKPQETSIETDLTRYFAYTKDGKFHETKYIYRDIDYSY